MSTVVERDCEVLFGRVTSQRYKRRGVRALRRANALALFDDRLELLRARLRWLDDEDAWAAPAGQEIAAGARAECVHLAHQMPTVLERYEAALEAGRALLDLGVALLAPTPLDSDRDRPADDHDPPGRLVAMQPVQAQAPPIRRPNPYRFAATLAA